MNITGRYGLFVLGLSVVFFAPAVASAGSINIQEVSTLTFPNIGIYSGGGSVNLSVSPLNSATSGNGQIISGNASRGQYALSITSGSSPISISIDISNVNTGNSGLTLDSFRGFYMGQTINSFPSSTLAVPATAPASTPFYLGAKVTASPLVEPGNYSASFSMTVFVQ